MSYFSKACLEREELLRQRRYLHQNAETGLHLPKTKSFIKDTLHRFNIECSNCGHGLSALIGSGEKTILLRADADALPMQEESGLPFACPKDAAHTCGHDLHTAMLLTAAKLLKEDETQLKGTVKLMFQPAEETFEGSQNMIENGILRDPAPDAALAFHVSSGQDGVGLFRYNDASAAMFSVDGFRITVRGRGSHGAYPQYAVDPINIAVHIHLALQELIARECDPFKKCVVTVGNFSAGSAANVIPDTAVLQGTIRTDNPESRTLLKRRLKDGTQGIAKAYGGEAHVESLSACPPLVCNPSLTRDMARYMEELPVPGLRGENGFAAAASEDFAFIAEKIPSAFFFLSAGFDDSRGSYSAHNPKVQFNEDVLPFGAACFAHCARRWLEDNA